MDPSLLPHPGPSQLSTTRALDIWIWKQSANGGTHSHFSSCSCTHANQYTAFVFFGVCRVSFVAVIFIRLKPILSKTIFLFRFPLQETSFHICNGRHGWSCPSGRRSQAQRANQSKAMRSPSWGATNKWYFRISTNKMVNIACEWGANQPCLWCQALL